MASGYKLTLNRFNIQAKVWKRENREIYNEFMTIADSMGILGKRGNILKPRTNEQKSRVDRFLSRYAREYGSFSSYKKEIAKRRKKSIEFRKRELIKEEIKKGYNLEDIDERKIERRAIAEVGKSIDEYSKRVKTLNETINELKEKYYELGKRNDFTNAMDYIKPMSSGNAIIYIRGLLDDFD